MTYLKLTTILTASAVALFASDVYAADGSEAQSPQLLTDTVEQPETPTLQPQKTEALETDVLARNMEALPEADITKIYVKAPIDSDRFIPVEAGDGTTYYNRTILAEDLKKVADDLETVDRYAITYDGTRYINKIVVPEDEQ